MPSRISVFWTLMLNVVVKHLSVTQWDEIVKYSRDLEFLPSMEHCWSIFIMSLLVSWNRCVVLWPVMIRVSDSNAAKSSATSPKPVFGKYTETPRTPHIRANSRRQKKFVWALFLHFLFSIMFPTFNSVQNENILIFVSMSVTSVADFIENLEEVRQKKIRPTPDMHRIFLPSLAISGQRKPKLGIYFALFKREEPMQDSYYHEKVREKLISE